MKKIAITLKEKDINGSVADVFGRAPYFLFAELKEGQLINPEIIENKFLSQTGGAGISTAQLIAEQEINVLITKNIGPRALDVLKQFNVSTYSGEGTVKEVVKKFNNNELEKFNK
jgi:predicted Fe-Mo cluster-binding NifX family protein